MKYELLKSNKESGAKAGMIFEWDDQEHCYTTKQMPWFLTPLIDKAEMLWRVKNGQFRRLSSSKKTPDLTTKPPQI